MKKTRVKLTDEEKKKCHTVIHGAAVAASAAAGGMSQIPLADNTVIAPIQVGMIIKLGTIFGHKVTEGLAKGIIANAAAAFVGRGVSQVLLGWVPIVGNAVNATTAGGITEAIGWLAVKEFKSKSTVVDSTDNENVEDETEEKASMADDLDDLFGED
ncbi:hypothetical protein [Acidaminobacter sp. JC074]|uniref:hypothetical protein n=1 Tax=Acidaminobacter sp. JC074 TaxID=2530199 RepID=UPI001F101B95|nr:hypothetical protein [Acidaminobacter sp. JC074]